MSVCDWIFFLPTWLNILILFIVLLYIYGVWPYKTTKMKFPGPPPTAIIGNFGQWLSGSMEEVDKENVKKYGDVSLTWLARAPQLLVADPDIIKDILVKQFPNFINRMDTSNFPMTELESKQITILEDDHWKFVRATLSPAFSSGRLREMVPLLQNNIDILLEVMGERAANGKSVDMQELYKAFVLDTISTSAFGMDSCALKNPEDEFVKLLKKLFARQISVFVLFIMLFPFTMKILKFLKISAFPKAVQETFESVARDVRHNIAQRKEQKTTRRDILQLMIDASVDDLHGDEEVVDKEVLKSTIQNTRKTLTETEIIAQATVFLLGGYATTGGAITMFSYLLAINPECQEKLVEEIDKSIGKDKPNYNNVMSLPYLDMCMSETLRLYPATQRLMRNAKEDITIKGHLIPKDLSVNIPINYLHTKPEYWPEPEIFRPERFTPEEKAKRNPYIYLPFGHGPRNCVGLRLAQLKVKMTIVSVLQHFRIIRSVDTEVPPKMAKFGTSEAVNGVWLKLEPRT